MRLISETDATATPGEWDDFKYLTVTQNIKKPKVSNRMMIEYDGNDWKIAI